MYIHVYIRVSEEQGAENYYNNNETIKTTLTVKFYKEQIYVMPQQQYSHLNIIYKNTNVNVCLLVTPRLESDWTNVN